MTTIVTLPRSARAAADRLNGIEELLTSKGWERAAIVAAFVDPHLSGRGERLDRDPRMSPMDFADLGIRGLTTTASVRLYARRWLDAHDGVPPHPGAKVQLPTDDWEGTRTGTDGDKSEEGARRKLESIAEAYPDLLAEQARKPEVAEAIMADVDASLEIVRAGRKESDDLRPSRPKPEIDGTAAVAIPLVMGSIAKFAKAAEDLEGVISQITGPMPWRPRDKDKAVEQLAKGLQHAQNARLLLTETVTDEALADLLDGG